MIRKISFTKYTRGTNISAGLDTTVIFHRNWRPAAPAQTHSTIKRPSLPSHLSYASDNPGFKFNSDHAKGQIGAHISAQTDEINGGAVNRIGLNTELKRNFNYHI